MSNLTKVAFQNQRGDTLSARLELPIDQDAHSYAIFAHCFTCNKNLSAVRNISRCLTGSGFGVLRFDFTGLGESEGAFEETNFSSNVGDIEAAADFLKANYQSPELLVGHSLGGAAVIAASKQIESVTAVATIGAPASPVHVSHLFEHGLEKIKTEGQAQINIGGRPFTIQQQFVEDLEAQSLRAALRLKKKALLFLHSPQDQTVEIDNASELYQAANHPKSFITLDGADHLLSRKEDSKYAGQVIAAWAKRYVTMPEKDPLKSQMEVAVRLKDEDKYTTEIKAGKHVLVADEPASVGGDDFGPSPYQYVAAGLGACTAMTLHMYARRKKWPLESVTVHINHGKVHAEDLGVFDGSKKIDVFKRWLDIEGELSEDQIKRLLEIADRCPVHRTLEQSSVIKTALYERV